MTSLKTLFAICIMALAPSTYAQLFELNFTVNPDIPAEIQTALQAEITKVEQEINEGLPSAQPDRMMEGMANSSVMSGKGVGSDYASNMEVFLVGGGVGVGADLAKDETTDSDLSGIGLQGGLIVGTNLGWLGKKTILGLDASRLNVYANFFTSTLERDLDESNLTADLSSFGIHASYLWKRGNKSKMFGWGGLRIHTGIERNKSVFKFARELNETVEVEEDDYNANGTLTGKPEATIEAATTSIPVEISTSVQLLYVLSVYTGLGMDYNMGYAEGKGSLNAEPTDISCSGAGCAGETSVGSVSPEANIDSKGKVNPFTTRGFVGVQINLPYFRIFGQVDKAFGTELIGATAGARFVF